MMDKKITEQGETAPPVGSAHGGSGTPAVPSRRRLIRGGVVAGPVLLALSSRSAIASGTGVCVFPSTWASMAMGTTAVSHHGGNQSGCYGGLSPGYWSVEQHRVNWPSGAIPDHLPSDPKDGSGQYSGFNGPNGNQCGGWLGDGTKFSAVFGSTPPDGTADTTLSQALCLTSSYAFHFTAGYLNALKFPGKYIFTPQEMINLWNGNFQVGGVYWTREQAVEYINQMYHLGTP